MIPLLIFLCAYFVPPWMIHVMVARLWLRSFPPRAVQNLLTASWAYTCFAAPMMGWMLLGINWWGFVRLSEAGSFATLKEPLAWLRWIVPGYSLPGAVLLITLPVCIFCFGFDWWLARRHLQPRDSIERRHVELWLWTSNLIWAVWLTGLLAGLLWLLEQVL